MLETIHSPADVRRLSVRETQDLAAEIRQALIDAIAVTGGHLASNLGAVELTLALHRVFETPQDKIIFDVGHQSYTHKLITDRQDLLKTLRCEGGISGFPKRSESAHDAFETGHASTALSAALGMARARDLAGEDYAIATLVGDGALTGGMCYEALNDAGSRPTQLIMLLNDNEMSIAHNVGALSKYLTRLRGSEKWIDAKHTVKKGLHRIPLIGSPIARLIEKTKRTLKLLLVPGEFFEALGFAYLGPIDGHDILTVERALRDAKAMKKPVVIHAVTQKGKGYSLAERQPEHFHGVAPFFVSSGRARRKKGKTDMRDAHVLASKALMECAARDARIVAITAAMPQGTGLSDFAAHYPDRFFDVGIAEEHAMTLAAGMAAGGLRPVFAVYASFLQRAVDQLLHDVCLQHLPVTILVDHAGFVTGDGETHQGVYDLPMLRAMPGLKIYAPCDAQDLRAMLKAALADDGPCVIRYPKQLPLSLGTPGPVDQWRCLQEGSGPQIIAYGHALKTATEAAAILAQAGVACGIWGATTLHSLDAKALKGMPDQGPVAVIEEGCIAGGLSEAIALHYARRRQPVTLLPFGVENHAPGAHSMEGLVAECGMQAQEIANKILELTGDGK